MQYFAFINGRMVGIEAIYLLDLCQHILMVFCTPGQTQAASHESPYLSDGSLAGLH